MSLNSLSNLFVDTFRRFQSKTSGYPIRFNRRIMIWHMINIESLSFNWENEDESILMFAKHIQNISKSDYEFIYNSYLQILYVDKLFEHYIKYAKEYQEVCLDLMKEEYNLDREYWLFDISPELIVKVEKFSDVIEENRKIWIAESEKLRQVLEKQTLFSPLDSNGLNLSYIIPRLKMEL